MERVAIVIVGPTCSGKTDLSLMLAEHFNTEIISADSRQIFKYLNIGTAKPDFALLSKIKHHFIDELLPDEEFNVNNFEKKSLSIIDKLFIFNKLPIIAGGSGLYIKALVDGIFDNVEIEQNIRIQVKDRYNKFGPIYLYHELKEKDPVSAEKMLPSNWKRVIRALEVFDSTGKPIWYWQQNYKRESNINFIQYGLNWSRSVLYSNIESRVDKMLQAGLLAELENVLGKGFGKNLNALNTVGYKELVDYLENKISLEKAEELIKRNTRRYAKRQMTWFNKDERINWFNISSANQLNDVKEKIIDDLQKFL